MRWLENVADHVRELSYILVWACKLGLPAYGPTLTVVFGLPLAAYG
jgi:hypothetical protein